MLDTINGQELHPSVLELARGQNFAALTTLLPSGHPQTQVMWVDANEQADLVRDNPVSQPSSLRCTSLRSVASLLARKGMAR